MKRRKPWLELLVVIVLVALGLAYFEKSETVTPESSPTPISPPATASPSALTTTGQLEHDLLALDGKSPPTLTESTSLLVQTDAGDYTLEVFPQAAPNAVARFLELVDIGFYDNTPVSRVVPDFVVQFGINSKMVEWKEKTFKDDPSLFQHLPGTIAFAKAGPDTNSTQVFINLGTNNRLASPGMNFTVFGVVTEGYDSVESSVEIGQPGSGLDQARLWADSTYLDGLAEKPTMITSIRVLDPEF